jgi:hypothetical protein
MRLYIFSCNRKNYPVYRETETARSGVNSWGVEWRVEHRGNDRETELETSPPAAHLNSRVVERDRVFLRGWRKTGNRKQEAEVGRQEAESRKTKIVFLLFYLDFLPPGTLAMV